jgi:hypothetical protein
MLFAIITYMAHQVDENASFDVFLIPRAKADIIYLGTMYDKFPVPESVTELRLVYLQGRGTVDI